MEITMPTNIRAFHLARAVVLAAALVVPTISTLATTAYADNESFTGIAAPYQATGNDKELSGSSRPPANTRPAPNSAPDRKGDASTPTGRQDEGARDIYKPGVSDR